MLGWIKTFFEWPKGGPKNITEFGNWALGRWWQLLLLVVIALVVIKLLSWIFSLFRSNNN